MSKAGGKARSPEAVEQDSVTQEFLESLKSQTEGVERSIAAVRSATVKILSHNEQGGLAVGEEVARLTAAIAQVIKDGVAQAGRGKALLDQLKKDGDKLSKTNPQSERLPLYKAKYARLCTEYVAAMKDHQKAKESMRRTQVDSVVRQVSTLPKFKGRSDGEIRAEVEKAGGAAQYLQEAIMEEAADEAQDAYRDAQSRAKDIEMLLRSIQEVSSMFQDLATLIQHQTETLDSIEKNVDSAGNFMRKGNKALNDTINYQKKTRKCYCCMIVVLILVILAVTIGVGSFFGVKQNSGRLRL